MPFDNSYARLPEKFFQKIIPEKVKSPELIKLNHELADELGLKLPEKQEELAAIFSGNKLLEGSEPIAQAYAGHQFGHFVPQLGDGRAVLLGEIINKAGKRYDIQLKGSGRTRFSRGGDGRSPLGPVIREYIISEAITNLGIPSSRGLAMVRSGETVFREKELPGAVFTRVASSHIRVGTFEFFASRRDNESVKILADYVINRHYPQLKEASNPYTALLEKVCEMQANLIAKWMRVGFIHGVMNTDNTSICGETIDFGPCAFMDSYDPATVFSSIDHHGRYAYGRQPKISQWNMAALAGCMLPLFHDNESKAREIGETIIDKFQNMFKKYYFSEMSRKIGIQGADEKTFEILNRILEMMDKAKADFTNTFRSLSRAINNEEIFIKQFSEPDSAEKWLIDWKMMLEEHGISEADAYETMHKANPAFIARNHLVEEAIKYATQDRDYSYANQLIEVLSTPYDDQSDKSRYADSPKPSERVYQTFCGT
ncbi:protein adenylyltransferase SelO [Maridesulfovibrio zosterae]|uniref:protein adenylyltransferase SelO n=1 Tax=Maridesulfovibrio zosterae TaxID=82171 RepID=UPI0004121B73|nr:YdiU family protein [Maridesulfovibrio zosterae]